MKFSASKKDLMKALSRCQGVASAKSTMPILTHVLVKSEGDDRIRIAATDLNMAISGTVEADVDEEGSFAVNARDVLERVKHMPDGAVSVTASNGTVTIKCGGARRFTLSTLDASDFPRLPEPAADAKVITFDASSFGRISAATLCSVSPDDSRPQLNSALLEIGGGKLRMVSTDGHRISKHEVSGGVGADVQAVLLPLRGLTEIRKLLDDADESVEFSASGENGFFDAAGFMLAVKLCNAAFPPWRQVIPETSAGEAKVSSAALADALTAVSVAANGINGGVKFEFTKSKIKLSGSSGDSGSGSDELDAECTKKSEVGLSAKFALDAMRAVGGGDIVIRYGADLDPIVITPAGSDDGYIAVIMPMRV
jgi:DNA polymerase-3 subunit beta